MSQYNPNNLEPNKFPFDRSLAETKAKDFVCGELVDPRTAIRETYRGRVFYFHSEECRRRFREDPSEFGS